MKTDTRSPSSRKPRQPPAVRRSADDRLRKRGELKRSTVDVYRAAILDGAERIFARRSFRDAKITEIARASGMATGTLYNYFDSKEAIIGALIDKIGDDLCRRLDALAGSDADPIPRLIEMVQAALAHFEEHRPMLLVITQLDVLAEVGVRPVAGEGVDRVQRRCLRIFENVVRQAVRQRLLRDDFEPADLVRALFGVVHGQVRASLAGSGRRSVAGKSASFFELFLHGAARR